MNLDGFLDVTALRAAGIYALTWRSRVVYVGQARDLAQRLARHRSNMNSSRKRYSWEPRSNKMLFDGAHILPCAPNELDRLEREMINRYRPRYNIHHRPPTAVPHLAPIAIEHAGIEFILNPAPACPWPAEARVMASAVLTLHSLRPADLDVLVEGPRRHIASADGPATLRDVHHQMARLFAMGLRTGAVSERIGYTYNRVSTIRNAPAFEALVQSYRLKLDESFKAAAYDHFHLIGENSLRAERMLGDRLAEAMEGGEDAPHISTKELLAVARDGADRIGFGKRATNINLNADFASMLDRATARSREAMRTINDVTGEVDAAVNGDVPSPAGAPKLLRRA